MPSGAISISCGTTASPRGNGCVAAVACRGSCGTGRSSMPTSGLPGLPIEDVGPAGLADFGDRLARAAADVHVHQDDGIGRVVVPDVVMHLLEVPAIFSGLRARSPPSTPRTGCRRRERRRCSRARHCRSRSRRARARDRRPASARPRRRRTSTTSLSFGHVSWPGLAGTGNRVERPDELPVLRVVRLDAAARAAIAAGEADDHQPVEVERRGRDREVRPASARPESTTRPCPSARSSATSWPSSWPMNTLSSPIATPLLFQPQQTRADVRIEVRRVLPEDLAACRSTARTRRWRRCST